MRQQQIHIGGGGDPHIPTCDGGCETHADQQLPQSGGFVVGHAQPIHFTGERGRVMINQVPQQQDLLHRAEGLRSGHLRVPLQAAESADDVGENRFGVDSSSVESFSGFDLTPPQWLIGVWLQSTSPVCSTQEVF